MSDQSLESLLEVLNLPAESTAGGLAEDYTLVRTDDGLRGTTPGRGEIVLTVPDGGAGSPYSSCTPFLGGWRCGHSLRGPLRTGAHEGVGPAAGRVPGHG